MKKNFYKIVPAFLLVFFFTATSFSGCEKGNNNQIDEFPRKLTPILIAQNALIIGEGSLYMDWFPNKQFSVINTEADWNNLIVQLNSENNVTDNFTETNIDFSLYQVIFVIDEVKGNGGWSIDVTDVTENTDEIVVAISNLKTGNATSVVTQPFQIVKVPVSNKPIIFNDLTTSYQ